MSSKSADLKETRMNWSLRMKEARQAGRDENLSETFQLAYDYFGGEAMTIEDNEAMITRFFEELLDKENVGILSDLFMEDCVFIGRFKFAGLGV
jgi:hypothetical protein